MSTIRRLAKNTIVLLIAQSISYIIAFFYTVLAARYLGPSEYGIISTAIAIVAIYSVMVDFGTNQLIVRELARSRDGHKQFLLNVSIIKIVFIFLIYALLAAMVNISGYPQKIITIVYLLGISAIFSAFYLMLFSFFQAYERMEFQAYGLIINAIVMLLGTIVCIIINSDVTGFALVYITSALIVLIYSFIVFMTVFRTKFVNERELFIFNFTNLKNIVKRSWPIGIMALLVMIRLRVDIILLSIMAGEKAVGLYNAAYRFVDVASIIPSTMVSALFPILSYLYNASRDRFDAAASRAFKIMLYLAIPLVFIVVMFSAPIINLTFGGDFIDNYIALQILICVAGIMFMSTLTGTMFVASDKQVFSMILAIGTLILSIFLNVVLIPLYNYIGAAISALLTELAGLVTGIIILTNLGHKFNIRAMVKAPVFAIIPIILVILPAKLIGLNNIFIATVALSIYSIFIYRFGIDKEDVALVKEIYRARNLGV